MQKKSGSVSIRCNEILQECVQIRERRWHHDVMLQAIMEGCGGAAGNCGGDVWWVSMSVVGRALVPAVGVTTPNTVDVVQYGRVKKIKMKKAGRLHTSRFPGHGQAQQNRCRRVLVGRGVCNVHVMCTRTSTAAARGEDRYHSGCRDGGYGMTVRVSVSYHRASLNAKIYTDAS